MPNQTYPAPAQLVADDPVELTRAFVRHPSVTPRDEGALDSLQAVLEQAGFTCHRLRFSEVGTPDVDNLYARFGTGGRHFCFAGHTDVVPPGDLKAWRTDPFEPEVVDGMLHGRGSADMKGAIAAFTVAARRFLAARGDGFGGSISLLITGDEEGPAINGTAKVLRWLEARGERIDACLVGEPTSETQLGDMAKIGRRGSLNGRLTVTGKQGHVAYPHLADNPNHRLVRMLAALTGEPLDQGSEHFQPSSLQVTSIDVGNPAANVIPAQAKAAFNIRFNDLHSSVKLRDWLARRLDEVGGYELDIQVSGESFLTPPGPLSDLVTRAVDGVVGRKPRLSTTGGTSDARFIRSHCPVIELGLVGRTIHQVNECAAVRDIEDLTAIYAAVLDGYFAAA